MLRLTEPRRSEGAEKGSRLFRIYRAAHGSELASE